jgi:glycosyltransferase involved in cell wall biosynthesis
VSISVVIPTYNRLPYLRAAVASAREQTRPPEEILIVDDGSTDGTEQFARSLPAPVRYLRQANAGPAAARNQGFRAATGDWIALLDSDDWWPADKLARQEAFLRLHPHLAFVFGTQLNSRAGQTDAQPEILDPEVHATLRREAAGIRDFFSLLLRLNPVPTSSVLFRRDCLARTGGFDEARWRCEDYELWFRFAAAFPIGYLDHPLVFKRSQDDNLINDYAKLWAAHLDVLLSLPRTHPGRNLPANPAWRQATAYTRYRLGSFHLRRGAVPAALEHFGAFHERDLPASARLHALSRVKRALLAAGLGRLARRTPPASTPLPR